MALRLTEAWRIFEDFLGPCDEHGPGWARWRCLPDRRPAAVTLSERDGACVARFGGQWAEAPETGDLAHIRLLELPNEGSVVWLVRRLIESKACEPKAPNGPKVLSAASSEAGAERPGGSTG
jgi:hypothetical protein